MDGKAGSTGCLDPPPGETIGRTAMKNDNAGEKPTLKPRRRHGLGADGIEALRSRQGGRCAICRKPDTGKPGTRLAVDHDHTHCPGKIGCPECVRGLLCVQCNNLLRSARDDRRILRAAIDYLAAEPPSPEGRGMRRAAEPRPSIEDLPVIELISRLYSQDDDPRLMPRQGRRDRFFMMLLDAPAGPATVAEAGWMADNDPQGYREAIDRADPFYGGPGALKVHLAKVLPPTPGTPEARSFFRSVATERAKLGMASPGAPGAEITLRDVNAYLRSKASDDARGA
jgi:hypothetical protein